MKLSFAARASLLALASAVTMPPASSFCAAPKAAPKYDPWPQELVLCPESVGDLTHHRTAKGLSARIDKWMRAPSYLRLTMMELLLEEVLSQRRHDLVDYTYEQGGNDLGLIAGRATEALERLLGAELPKITPTSSAEHAKRVHAEAAKLLRVYRSGLLTLAGEYKIGKPKEVLRRAYDGKISPTRRATKDVYRTACVLAKLLQEWFPIGKKMSDLEEIVGYKTLRASRSRHAIYEFDAGRSGYLFHFKLSGELIDSVSIGAL